MSSLHVEPLTAQGHSANISARRTFARDFLKKAKESFQQRRILVNEFLTNINFTRGTLAKRPNEHFCEMDPCKIRPYEMDSCEIAPYKMDSCQIVLCLMVSCGIVRIILAKLHVCKKGLFARKKFVKMIICQNAHLPICTFTKIHIYQNAHLPKCFFARNRLQKCACKMSLCKMSLLPLCQP